MLLQKVSEVSAALEAGVSVLEKQIGELSTGMHTQLNGLGSRAGTVEAEIDVLQVNAASLSNTVRNVCSVLCHEETLCVGVMLMAGDCVSRMV